MVYVSATYMGYAATGMGCYSDTQPIESFEVEGMVPMYHMAVGHPAASKYATYEYSDRQTP